MRVLRAGWFMALTMALVAACVPTLPVTPAKTDKKASAAPSSKGDYYPMAEGTKWVYEMKLGDKVVGTATTRLKDVETEDGTTTAVAVTVLAFVGDAPAVTRATETKTATELTSTSGGITIGLKLPLKKNATWTSNGSTYKVVGQESLKVGTGDVKDAWKITQTSDAGSAAFWYGVGVGLVKFTSPGPEGEVTSTLKTFTASGAPALPEESASGASPSPSPSASASASPSPSPSPSASASASPSPSPSASPSGITVPTGEVDYFPMREGAKWVYSVKAKAFGLQVGTMTNRMGVLTGDTTPEATMTSVLNITVPAPQKQVTKVKYKKLAAEIQRAVGEDPFLTYLKLPLTVDATWEADGSSFKVEAKEDVTLSSGVIKDALRISTTTDGAKDVFWYGSQIGMIKFTATVQGNEIEAELKEYIASGSAALAEETP